MYADGAGIWVRRSTTSGVTWAAPVRLSVFEEGAWASAGAIPGWMGISGAGATVDTVWIEDWHVKSDAHVRYAASTDGGASYQPAVTVASPASGRPIDVAVARGPKSVVAITWTKKDGRSHSVNVKVSRDGGKKFGRKSVVASSGVVRDAKVAVGDGVMYVTYVERRPDGNHRLRLTRSLDQGLSWSGPVTLSSRLVVPYSDWIPTPRPPTITAVGRHAYVGYTSVTDGVEYARYRRTRDAGATWSKVVRLASRRSGSPVISVHDGVVRTAYNRCYNRSCNYSDIAYRERWPGQTWRSPERVMGPSDVWPWPSGVGFSGKAIVLWMLPQDGSGGEFGTLAAIRTP
jgi:hypothetical protein